MHKSTPLFLFCQSDEFGVYSIRNLQNGKVYIGSTSAMGFRERLKDHLRSLRRHAHPNSHLQRAWDLYGERSFVFEILDVISDKAMIAPKEQSYIDNIPPDQCYNIAPAMPGKPLSPETKAKISAKVSASLLGHIVSDESKQRMSAAAKGRKRTPESVAKTAAGNRGKSPSQEVRDKISAALKGRRRPPEVIRKVAESLRGKHRSSESIEKGRATMLATLAKKREQQEK